MQMQMRVGTKAELESADVGEDRSADGASDEATSADAEAPAKSADTSNGADAEVGEKSAQKATEPDTGGGGGPDAGSGEATGDSSQSPAANRRHQSQDDQSRGDRSQGRQSRGGQSGADQSQGDQSRGGQSRGGQSGGGQSGGDEEPEAGNRKRRRRGRSRDRDRPEEDQALPDPIEVTGLLDLRDEGYGFLRTKGYLPSKDDAYVSLKQVRQYGLRKGDHVKGMSRPASRNEKNPALLRVDEVNGGDPEAGRQRPSFEDLTPLFPDEKLRLEQADDPMNMTARIVDLIAPIGKGQRGLIVSPPKAGKTTVMKTIAQSIEANDPDVHLIVLLVDERPEEVTDMRRSVRGDVVASTFDRPSDEHTAVAEMTIERAKRLVEDGRDVVIILDGITRLARAYNLAAPATGRIMSGGIDTGALYPPKKFFGAARNIEEGGSLTILATALVETGSKMDEVIFEEFKGTGNMELRLDRHLAERRIYPAIDVDASSTRHEELLFERKQLQMVWKLRRVLSGLASDAGGAGSGLEMLIDRLSTFASNDEFLAEVAKAPTATA